METTFYGNDGGIAAQITPGGNIRLYNSYISMEKMNEIAEAAKQIAEKFRQDFEKLPEQKQENKIYMDMSVRRFIEFMKDKPSIEKLREYYYSIA